MASSTHISFFFFFNDTATTEIYTLSLHDALPISLRGARRSGASRAPGRRRRRGKRPPAASQRARPASVGLHRSCHTRSEEHTSEPSHSQISYAVFCLKKKKKQHTTKNSS